jgi:hypothetical protein
MPKLIRLYVVSVAVGFGLALAFVALLLALDIGGLRRLVLGSEVGWLAGLLLVVFNGIVFAGAQFGIAVMRLGEPERRDPPRGPPRPELGAAPVAAIAPRRPAAPRR